MNKQEFLARLEEGLSGLPQEDIAERLAFYGEMIDDRMEEGLTEEEAVAGIGSADQVISQVIGETPISRIVREKIRPKRRLQAWEITLLVLGSPLWLSLVIAAFAVILSVYAVIWSVILSLWAADASLAVSAVGGTAAGIVLLCTGDGVKGIFLLSSGLICAGLAVFLFFGCRAASRGAWALTKKIASGIKVLILGKENAK